MSVMKKMISTDKYLSQIYKEVKSEIRKSSNLNTEISQARKLQALLRQVKYMQKQYGSFGNISIDDNFPFASFWSKAEQIAMMNALYQINPKLFTEGTFINTFKGSESQSYLLGESLEIGFARLVRSIAAKASNQTYAGTEGVVKSKVGGLHTQVPDLNKTTNDIMSNIFNQCYQEASQQMKQYKGNTELPQGMRGMHSVQGKIDNIGLTAEFVASVSVEGMDRDIVMALKDATFTAKNYLSTTELKFGQTNPFRVFATVAPAGEDTVSRYSRMLNCFEDHGAIHSSAPITFYRLRAIYELTGARMQYTDKALSQNSAIRQLLEGNVAKFLIWNTPYGDIRVIPTRKIIDNVIESAAQAMPKGWQDALYGPIVLQQSDLSNLS